MMGEWIVAQAGTASGQTLALILALFAAVSHATFGALQTGKQDPWLVRGSIDLWLVIFSFPVAIFLVPWPQGIEWPLMAGAVVIHLIYKLALAMAYERGAFTVVYPVVRGGGVLFTVLGAWIVFEENFTLGQWLGVSLLVCGIFGLALYNLRHLETNKAVLKAALFWAVITAVTVAAYTTYDAFGIRTTPNPFTYLAWFFLLSSLDFPIIAWIRSRRMDDLPPFWPLMRRGQIGALIAVSSFGAIMIATRLDKVGEAAVLRETSIVFAALIGWVFLKDRVGPRRLGLMVLIALGAVIVEFAA